MTYLDPEPIPDWYGDSLPETITATPPPTLESVHLAHILDLKNRRVDLSRELMRVSHQLNAAIIAAVKDGITRGEIARTLNVSRERVGQVTRMVEELRLPKVRERKAG